MGNKITVEDREREADYKRLLDPVERARIDSWNKMYPRGLTHAIDQVGKRGGERSADNEHFNSLETDFKHNH